MQSYQQAKFASRPAAYSYIILRLDLFKNQLSAAQADLANELATLIEKIKIAFENHEADISRYAATLLSIKNNHVSKIDETRKKLLNILAEMIAMSSTLKPSLQVQYENEFQRQFESIFAINLLFNPTDAMMASVGRVSDKIIEFVAFNKEELFNEVIVNCSNKNNTAERFGVAKKSQTLEELLEILETNKKSDLATIMHIHYSFWMVCKNLARDKNCQFNFQYWDARPVGFFADHIDKRLKVYGIHNKDYSRYKGVLERKPAEVAYLSDEHFYVSIIYNDKGRKGALDLSKPSNQLGLMLLHQYTENLPKLADDAWLSWAPDVLCQQPDFESRYVKNLLINDGVYVAGPSGMISVLLSLMEIVGNVPTTLMKQNYLGAAVAFIVSGGFHSMHEVLEPAEFCVKLVPGYNASMLHASNHFRSLPPNYHVFFALFANDQQFQALREKSWHDFLTDFVALKFNANQKQVQQSSSQLENLGILAAPRAAAAAPPDDKKRKKEEIEPPKPPTVAPAKRSHE